MARPKEFDVDAALEIAEAATRSSKEGRVIAI